MRFFFDRNISIHLARMIAAFDRENQVEHQDDDARFAPTTSDIELIETLARDIPPPIFITADVSQRRRPPERQALAQSGMSIVFFRSGFHDLTHHMQAIKVLRVWPNLVRSCGTAKVPTVFQIPPSPSSEKIDRVGPTVSL